MTKTRRRGDVIKGISHLSEIDVRGGGGRGGGGGGGGGGDVVRVTDNFVGLKVDLDSEGVFNHSLAHHDGILCVFSAQRDLHSRA